MISATVCVERPNYAIVRPTVYLGTERFAAFRRVLAEVGATYVAAYKYNLVLVSQLPQLADRLAAIGLGLEVEEQLKQSLIDAARAARESADAGLARVHAAEQRMAARGVKLYPFQKTGVRWLAPRRGALLADEMGLGKTIQVLCALPDNACVLVVCPLAVTRNWVNECHKWRPDLHASLCPSGAFRWPEEGELVAMTYGQLPGDIVKDEKTGRSELVLDLPVPAGSVYVIADEAHMLKNAKSNRTRRFREVSSVARDNSGSVWLLTATPQINRDPMELWNVLDAADLATPAFGTKNAFVAMFGGHLVQVPVIDKKTGKQTSRKKYEWTGKVSSDVPLALQKVSLLRKRTEVLPELPGKTRRDVLVELDHETAELCTKLIKALAEKDRTIESLVDGTSGGVGFELMSTVRAALAASKLRAALDQVELFEENGEPLVVFSAHVEPLRVLSERDGWALVDGSVTGDERENVIARFQAGEYRGIACSYGAGGVGITLTRASHALQIDFPWSPALIKQAEDRLCRIGQKNACQYVRMVADHDLERQVVAIIDAKIKLIEQSVDASAVGGDHEPESLDEKLARAAELVVSKVEAGAHAAQVSREQLAQANLETARRRAAGEFAPGVWGEMRTGENGKAQRGPRDAIEARAGGALIQIAALDPDHAAEQNGVGFDQRDGDFGHSLAAQLVRYGRLSEKQWACVLKLAHKYRRQIDSDISLDHAAQE